jgi:ferritin-like metal-binding protein YciE
MRINVASQRTSRRDHPSSASATYRTLPAQSGREKTMPDTTPTINTYVSDMLALEKHIRKPLAHQVDDTDIQASATASRIVREALDTLDAQEAALESLLDNVGGHAGSPVKSTVASVLGDAAAAIGNVRKTEVSKYLRDDYAALCLATAGYTMLQTTARGLHDSTTAALAERHLADYATIIMKINAALPTAVLSELAAEGATVDPSVVDEANKASEDAWHQGAARSHLN